MRTDNRHNDQLRSIDFELNVNPYAEGACLVRFGHTHVLCTASLEDNVPRWRKGKGQGWVSAEYGMLPRATHSRSVREAARGKQGGRTVEIQRLIGRSLRASIDLKKLGEQQILIDCDVLQADGGTRTAAISGAWVALFLACNRLVKKKLVADHPMTDKIAAVSCGIVKDQCCLDLNYSEDRSAQADANFVLTSQGHIIEIQMSAETAPFAPEQMAELLRLAQKGIGEICEAQAKMLAEYNASEA